MTTLLQDLRYAGRMLVKNPVFSVAAVATLALGIGLNAAVFSGVEALLLRPLPGVREPDRLVQVYRSWPGIPWGSNSIPHFFDLKERTTDVFSGVAAWSFAPLSASVEGQSSRIMGQMVSADYFAVLGVNAVRGRTFLPSEDVGPGEHPVVVLSYDFWQSRFAGTDDVVGRTLELNGRTFTVVGVAPSDFKSTIAIVPVDLWVPLMMQTVVMPGTDLIEDRGHNFLLVLGRLQPGVTFARAREAMDGVLAGLREDYPGAYDGSGIRMVPQSEAGIHPQLAPAQVGLSTVLMALVGLLLLIACVNVANLFLARASERRREMGIRLSLGAPRGRIVRQLVTESMVFSTLAGGLSLALAWVVVRIASGIRLPIDMPMDFGLRLDTPVLLFTLGVSLATGLVFGLVPALQASKPELVSALKGDGGDGSGSRSRVSRTLVVAQLALSLLLLVGAGLFLRSLGRATTLDKGFTSDHLLLASMDPGLQGYTPEQASVFYDQLLERLRALPGVRAAGLGEMVPLGLGGQQTGIEIPGYEPAEDEQMSIDYNVVGPGYFDAMGIQILQGRGFTDQDDADAPGVLVVNQRFAERFWPGQDAIGQVVRFGSRDRTVVGLTPTGKYGRLSEEPKAYMYFAFPQRPEYAMTLHLRTAQAPASLAPQVRAVVRELDPNLPLYDVRTMENYLGIALLPARLGGILLGVFGLLGLALAAIGIYGVMAFNVARRTREIGIRIALGAHRGEVVAMVLRQGGRLIAVGTAIGLVAGLLAGRALENLLYGISAADPITFVAVPAVLVAVALLATWVPARRAAAVDPVRAIRSE